MDTSVALVLDLLREDKNSPEISGWQWFAWVFRFDVGHRLLAFRIFSFVHNLHLKIKLKTPFFPLMASSSSKNSEMWANFCLNLANCSSSAISYCNNFAFCMHFFLLNNHTYKYQVPSKFFLPNSTTINR